jgi:hypothetical protein
MNSQAHTHAAPESHLASNKVPGDTQPDANDEKHDADLLQEQGIAQPFAARFVARLDGGAQPGQLRLARLARLRDLLSQQSARGAQRTLGRGIDRGRCCPLRCPSAVAAPYCVELKGAGLALESQRSGAGIEPTNRRATTACRF